jgi:hypothetical protein
VLIAVGVLNTMFGTEGSEFDVLLGAGMDDTCDNVGAVGGAATLPTETPPSAEMAEFALEMAESPQPLT